MKRLLTISLAVLMLVQTPIAQAQDQATKLPLPRVEAIDSISGAVWTHLDSSTGITIERNFDTMHGDWRPVCSAPCDQELPSDPDYRVAGPGIRPSGRFVLRAPDGGRTDIHVHAGSKFLSATGWTVFGIGSLTILSGFAVLLANRALFQPSDSHDDMVGAILLASGTPVMLGGLALALTNRRTTVSQDVLPRRVEDRGTKGGTSLPFPTGTAMTVSIIHSNF